MMNITHTAATGPGVGVAPRRRHGPQPARRLVPECAQLDLRDDAERVLLTGGEPDRRVAVALQQRVGGVADGRHDAAGQLVPAEPAARDYDRAAEAARQGREMVNRGRETLTTAFDRAREQFQAATREAGPEA